MFGDVKVDEITDVDEFKRTYFPQGFDAENAGYTVSVLFVCTNRAYTHLILELFKPQFHYQ